MGLEMESEILDAMNYVKIISKEKKQLIKLSDVYIIIVRYRGVGQGKGLPR